MFIDEEWKKNSNNSNSEKELDFSEKPKFIKPQYLITVVIFFIVSSLGAYYFYIKSDVNKKNSIVVNSKDGNSSSTTVLPKYFGEDNPRAREGYIPDDLKAEDLNFGSFYTEPSEKSVYGIKRLALPLNIKSDVVNYYDISRKISLESEVEELNKNGYAFLKTAFGSEKNDFFQLYRELIKNEVPIFVSSDFVRYYNQNVLKQVYKDIEKSVFYENLWDICKKLYDISLARYNNHLERVGLDNSALLEGERLETAFLAVALELLRPKENQISSSEAFLEENLFTEQESQVYYFNMPRDLQREVLNEVELIYKGVSTDQSPVFLYKKDYTSFSLPEEYRIDSKLKNYYLAKKWMNSLFPLYYQDSECEKCLLDYNDWLNNFAAINLLTNDLNDNQDLKNRWAAIYKFIAFFEGLRSDLTYLHLNQAKNKVVDGGQAFELLFTESNEQSKYIKDLQQKLEEFLFLPIEGKTAREGINEKPFVGIRMLQNNFWPNDYIFSELTGVDYKAGFSPAKEDRITGCRNPLTSKNYRCLSFSGDILNIYGIAPQNNDYYQKNFDYLNYSAGLNNILEQIELFDNGTWNSNVFWLNFDLSNTVVKNAPAFVTGMSLNEKWIEEKVVNEVLGAWVNIVLPKDEWGSFQMEKNKNFGQISECNLNNYIEPQVELYADMIERNKMLLSAIEVLRVGKKTNTATLALAELNNKLVKFKNISQHEIQGEFINENECHELIKIVSETNVLKPGSKNVAIGKDNNKIKLSLEGSKLMAFVKTQKDDQRILVVGPVFNFKEER